MSEIGEIGKLWSWKTTKETKTLSNQKKLIINAKIVGYIFPSVHFLSGKIIMSEHWAWTGGKCLNIKRAACW